MTTHRGRVDSDADGSFQSFYTAHWLHMVRLAVLLTGDSTHAEDAVQEAFLSAHKKWTSFDASDSPRGYVRAAVVNQCRNVRRKRRTLARKAAQLASESTAPSPLEIVGPQYDMWKAVSTLSPRMRAVLVLRYYEDCDIATTARLLSVSEGTVKSTTSKALAQLRDAIS